MQSIYDLQALAAMRRCLEVAEAGGPWWAAADAVRVALAAMEGDADAKQFLDSWPTWELDENGELPASA